MTQSRHPPDPIGDDSTEDIAAICARMLARFPPPAAAPYEAPCGLPRWQGEAVTGEVYCVGGQHYTQDPADPALVPGQPSARAIVIGRCPAAIAAEIRARVEAERDRLAGAIARCQGATFDTYDRKRHPQADRAVSVMRRFSLGRPPKLSILLTGETGLGKTHLLLASYFAHLEAGVSARYATSGELRPIFRSLTTRQTEAREEAEGKFALLASASVLYLDDLADVRGTPDHHVDFAAGLKRLLDEAKGVRAVALNCGYEAARHHPDLGDRIMSRLSEGTKYIDKGGKPESLILRMTGADQRDGGST